MASGQQLQHDMMDADLGQQALDDRAEALRRYTPLPAEVRAKIVKHLILPSARSDDVQHPPLDVRPRFIPEDDAILALQSMSWMEVILEHGGKPTPHTRSHL